MQSIEQKIRAYKRGTIKQMGAFLKSGLVTASEVESIANKSTLDAIEQGMFK